MRFKPQLAYGPTAKPNPFSEAELTKTSDYSAHIIALLIVCLGLFLLVVGLILQGKLDYPSMLTNAGSALALVGAFQWIYDFTAKKALHNELIETVIASRTVADSGVSEYFTDSKEVRFRKQIEETKDLVTLFSCNSRFLVDYRPQIETLLNNGGTARFIFLRRDSPTISLMKNLGWDEPSLNSNYTKIDQFHAELRDKYNERLQICYVDNLLRYSAVKFDNSIYVIWNTCSPRRQPVPAMRVRSNTPLWDFFKNDIESLKEKTS
ncbi:hypothetical protein VRZ08_09630 [Rhodopseudomonas sp. G2_2311]|uniref:hypothetical protein n=1 Tax=Rhodopseudomonas sp. G2_2311 TaxID=3114287 RepID=UPI0039C60809